MGNSWHTTAEFYYVEMRLFLEHAALSLCASDLECAKWIKQVAALCAEGPTKAVMLLPIIMKGRKLHFLIHTLRHLDTETIMHQTVEDTFGPSK